jgi:hypothetical protein
MGNSHRRQSTAAACHWLGPKPEVIAVANIESHVISAITVREHFSDALQCAARNQDVALRDTTSAYVINLLTEFCQANALVDLWDDGRHIKPLALMYADAIYADDIPQRLRALRKLGDFALFVSGIFTDSLQRRAVDVDYYIGMGEAAYSSLHESLNRNSRTQAAEDLFDELGRKFSVLVDLLAEISEISGLKSNSDVLRNYELWLKTGSMRTRKQLARSGILTLTPKPVRVMH